MNLFALFEENHGMLLDVDAVAYAGGHGHPAFADVVVVVIDHDVEAERLGEEVVGDTQGIRRNGDEIDRLRSFTHGFQLEL